MKYYPDKWVIIKVTHPVHGTAHKILSSWYGGFGGSNSWKLSSGITNTARVIDIGVFEFPQYSGSSYIVDRVNYGMSTYTQSIYEGWLTILAEDPNQGTIELLDQDFDLASVLGK